MSQTTADQAAAQMAADNRALNEKLMQILNLQADTALKEAQFRLARLQERNLNADTGYKRAQEKFVPWQIASATATATAAIIGAAVAIGHWL